DRRRGCRERGSGNPRYHAGVHSGMRLGAPLPWRICVVLEGTGKELRASHHETPVDVRKASVESMRLGDVRLVTGQRPAHADHRAVLAGFDTHLVSQTADDGKADIR